MKKIIKYEINKILVFFLTRLKYLKILSFKKTINYVLKHHSNVSRYGDGELNMIFNNKNIGFQKYNKNLSADLYNTFINHNNNVLICIPSNQYMIHSLKKQSNFFGFLG